MGRGGGASTARDSASEPAAVLGSTASRLSKVELLDLLFSFVVEAVGRSSSPSVAAGTRAARLDRDRAIPMGREGARARAVADGAVNMSTAAVWPRHEHSARWI